MVRVEARKDLRDRSEVAIDELAQTPVVIDRARARTTGHEQLEARYAERVLHVDGQHAEAKRVLGRRTQAMTLGPRARLPRAGLVRNAPDRVHSARVKVRWNRKLTHVGIHYLAHRVREPVDARRT